MTPKKPKAKAMGTAAAKGAAGSYPDQVLRAAGRAPRAPTKPRGETASLKGGLTHGMSAGPYDGRDERRSERTKTEGAGALGATDTYRDPQFYAKKRAVERVLGRDISIEEFMGAHYVPDDAPTAMGTSIFDPVLCELVYRWFCPAGGSILDPFAGGSVRGVVAGMLGRPYTGIDLSERQVHANRVQAELIFEERPSLPKPGWLCGDSGDTLAAGSNAGAAGLSDFDLVFSCPPYADLEVYSDDPRDLSTMKYPAFRQALERIVAASCARLKPDRFACFVVGDVRGPDGAYRNFPGHTVDAFTKAGLALYNDAILVTAAGSLPIRAGRQFAASRKLGTTHQRILVFLKGDARRAVQAIGPVEFGDIEAAIAALEDEADAAVARVRLAEIEADPGALISGAPLAAALDKIWGEKL